MILVKKRNLMSISIQTQTQIEPYYFRESEAYLERVDAAFLKLQDFYDNQDATEESAQAFKEKLMPELFALISEKIYASEKVSMAKHLLYDIGEEILALFEMGASEDPQIKGMEITFSTI